MKKLASVAALALASTLTLAACGGNDGPEPEPSPSPTQSTDVEEDTNTPAEAPEGFMTAEGKGYTVAVPETWEEADEGSGPDLYYMDNETMLNMNTVLTPAVDITEKSEIQKLIVGELEAVNFTNVQFPDEIDVDGETGYVATAELDLDDAPLYTYQFFVTRGANNYVFTVGGFDRAEVDELGAQMSSTWQWS